MRKIFFVVALSALGACATTEPTDASANRDKELTTGSNIPRRGQAVTVDKSVIDDARLRGSGQLQR